MSVEEHWEHPAFVSPTNASLLHSQIQRCIVACHPLLASAASFRGRGACGNGLANSKHNLSMKLHFSLNFKLLCNAHAVTSLNKLNGSLAIKRKSVKNGENFSFSFFSSIRAKMTNRALVR